VNSDEVCKVEWWTPIPGIEKIEPIRPGLNFIPEWVKNIPKSSNELVDGPSPQPHKTIRDCPGFIDLYKHSYVIAMWCDMTIQVGSKFKILPSNEIVFGSKVTQFKGKHFINYIPDHAKSEYKVATKFVSPWRVRTSPGWGMLQLPMMYDYNPNFECLSGLIHSDLYHEVNQQLIIKHTNEFLLKRGTPLAMYIPIKLTDHDFTVGVETLEQKLTTIAADIISFSKFRGAYRDYIDTVKGLFKRTIK